VDCSSCLHLDYQLIGHVQLEVGYQPNQQSDSDDGHLLCTLVPNSTHVGWFSADIPLHAGQYQLYFDAVILSLEESPVVALDSVMLLDENCTRITFIGTSIHLFLIFLLLARYGPNVAKRSI